MNPPACPLFIFRPLLLYRGLCFAVARLLMREYLSKSAQGERPVNRKRSAFRGTNARRKRGSRLLSFESGERV